MVIYLVLGLYFGAVYNLVIGLTGRQREAVAAVSAKTGAVRQRLAGATDSVEALGNKLPGSLKNYYIKQLVLAGSPRNFTVESFISIKLMSSFGATMVSFLGMAIMGVSPLKVITFILIIATVSFFVPDLWLSKAAERRQKAIQKALPDTLDLLTISIEAGLGFDAALAKVSKNTSTALSEEFFRLLQEIQLGVSRRDAFKNLLARTDVQELSSLILAIIQADVFGIAIGKVLRVQSKEMRVKRRQRAEEAAMKTPVKIVFPLILCIFPALNIVVLGPAAIQIYNQLFGL